mgnify:CR=1 FL=1
MDVKEIIQLDVALIVQIIGKKLKIEKPVGFSLHNCVLASSAWGLERGTIFYFPKIL